MGFDAEVALGKGADEAVFLSLGFCFLPHEISSLGVLTQAWLGVRRFQQGLCLVGWELAFLRARLNQPGWSSCFHVEEPLPLPPATSLVASYLCLLPQLAGMATVY